MSDASATYIHPVGWEKFQHGVKRGYPWIKLYTDLLANPRFTGLSSRQRGILLGLWILYHESGGEIVLSPSQLRSMLVEPTLQRRDLDSLNHAGFIVFSASRRREDEIEEKNPPVVPPKGGRAKPKIRPSASSPTGSPATVIVVRERNPGWDFLVELGGEPLERHRNAYGRVAADLNELAGRELNGAGPDEYLELFRRRRQALVDEWGEGKATTRSLVQNWGVAKRLSESRGRPASGAGAIGQKALEVASQLRREGR